MRDRYAKAWPKHAKVDARHRAYVLELSAALVRDYRTDAHFAAYATPNGRRLDVRAPEQLGEVAIVCVVFDVDCPDVHGTSEPAPEPWRRRLRDRVQELAAVHPGPYYYETRGGARIVYRQESATVIRGVEDARAWSRSYATAVAHIEIVFGIIADTACGDWQRLYRLPRATRDGSSTPENYPVDGDPERIGCFMIEPTDADRELAARRSKAFDRVDRGVRDVRPCAASGDGLLYHLLDNRGDVLGQHRDPGTFIVRCPHERVHSTGRAGDTSTLLYLPAAGEHLGALHCLHAHCASLRATDWLRCFSLAEIQQAERDAGLRAA
jgi:hypothetical protein